ncbi:arginine N-succinyltransferase [Sphingosinicella soli]|uniref:Arginine N-succinyltransferase n=1 Tax=Sphingosinicella soli TaxID=333708 RepID=A0A7W7B140_9SPHN|nr:arginine N-succinyltransferase [Sphingosinicella soli]MBB4632113.1 arginine N-succinyltransferase [Sphingosinicella soli]
MVWFIRPARADDVDALLVLAEQTGGGFTNLPPDRDALARRIGWSCESFAREGELPQDELYMLLMEEAETGRIGGSAMIFSRLGGEWPFYTYKIATVNQTSKELGRNITMEVLHLTNDFNGAAEVGGLFLLPELRTEGLGRMLARSRYLFMARHRARFPARVVAELRGWHHPDGSSPFWDGLGRKFFEMPFQEADRFNSLHGNQFIADLMPRYPVYTALLSDEARAVIGKPHDSGVPALKLLEKEGFFYEGYVDIFDGGPTVFGYIDNIRTVQQCRTLAVADAGLSDGGATTALLAKGLLQDFRVWQSAATETPQGLSLTAEEVRLHGLQAGETISHVAA